MLQCDQKLVDLAIDIGEGLLTSGAEIHRVEDTITRICISAGAKEVDAFCIIKAMVVSVRLEDGSVYTASRRILTTAMNYKRIDHYNTLSRRICEGVLSLEDARAECEKIKSGFVCSDAKKLLGYILLAFSCTAFFGGSWFDAICTLPVCLVLILFDMAIRPHGLNKMVYSFIAAFLSGATIMLTTLTGLPLSIGPMVAGTLMILIPGIAMTGSLEDLLTGDTTSGILSFCESLLSACAIVLGYALSLAMFESGDTGVVINYPWYVLLLFAVITTIAYALMTNVSTKMCPYLALGGALTYATFAAVSNASNHEFLSTLAATAAGTFFAYIAARILKRPTSIFSTPAVFPLAPGYALYLTISHSLKGDFGGMQHYAVRTLMIASGIALGLLAVSFLWGMIRVLVLEVIKFKRAKKN